MKICRFLPQRGHWRLPVERLPMSYDITHSMGRARTRNEKGPMLPTLEHLDSTVTTARFETLIGAIENEFFDAKAQPYQFTAGDHVKRELAKDVSAFANAGGGYIVVGLSTQASVGHYGEEVSAIRTLSRALCDPDQYTKIISEWVYPRPKGVIADWHQYGADPDKGIFVIFVPPQEELNKPFLITRFIEGSKTTEILVGYAQRRRDSTDVASVHEIQQTLRSGLSLERELLGRLDNLESLVERHFRAETEALSADNRAQLLRQRIDLALDHGDLKDNRAIILSAVPIGASSLLTVFSNAPKSLKFHLENPPELRDAGWDLGTLDRARIVKGELVRVANGNRKVIDLYRDGSLVFAALATREFIAWNRDSDLRINPLALIELVVSFTRFYGLVIADFSVPPGSIEFTIGLRNMHLNGDKTYLLPYGIKSLGFSFSSDRKEAPEDSWNVKLSVEGDVYEADRVAYQLVREFYLWFGQPEDVIPYSKTVNGKQVIDTDAIVSDGM